MAAREPACPACGVRVSLLPAGHEMVTGSDDRGQVTLICTDGVMVTGRDVTLGG